MPYCDLYGRKFTVSGFLEKDTVRVEYAIRSENRALDYEAKVCAVLLDP